MKPGREENGFGVFLFHGDRIVRDVLRPELVRTENDTIYLAGVNNREFLLGASGDARQGGAALRFTNHV